MKNYYYLIIAFVSSINVIAQPTVNSTDLLPSIGDQFTTHTTTYSSPGASGTGVTWNFASLTSSGTYTYSFSNPTATPFSTNFPTATLAIVSGGNSYSYLSSSSSHMSDIGWASSTSGYFCNYSNPKKLLSFPISFNNTVNDTYYGDYYVSTTHIENSGTVQIVYDGYGTLILPTGTYTNVVRFKKTDNAVNTSTSSGVPFSYTQNQTEYVWYKPGVHHALLSFIQTTTVIPGSPTTTSSSGYYFNPGSAGVEDNSSVNTINIYPNPSSKILTIDLFKTNQIKSFEVIDVLGKKVMSQEIDSNNSSIQLDVEHLQSGMYFIRFKDEGNNSIQVKKFQKL